MFARFSIPNYWYNHSPISYNSVILRTFSKFQVNGVCCAGEIFAERNLFLRNISNTQNRKLLNIDNRRNTINFIQFRGKRREATSSSPPTSSQNNDNGSRTLSHLFVPIPVKPISEDPGVGAELTGKLNKPEILKILNKFFRRSEIKLLSLEHGLDSNNEYVKIPHHLFHQAFISFRKFCLESENLPVDVHIIFSDIIQGAAHVDDLFVYFMRHAKQIFPHLECMDDLKKISDLRSPANWYPEARGITRKIIFHAGPTNSGKTYHALEKLMGAKSGIYCGPLKLLASEVFNKCNENGTPCDLITGEERRYALGEQNPSSHVSCTVEMASVTTPYEVAVIDEIQMIKDFQRGWAWSRALLGVVANEIHLCGEAAAIELVKNIMITTGEDVEVYKYKRLTDLDVEKRALESLDRVKPGDCIVCFSKNDIYSVSRHIERKGQEVAVIYGGLPPGTKVAQAQKFNDPNNPCKILVATDAIGMGLNLSIRRVIFYSLIKPTMNEKGEREMDTITTSQALQIAGRAGRYGTQFSKGLVTTYKSEDIKILERLMAGTPDELIQAGLHPTADQIEMYAYHLPNATLSNLMDIFVSLCTVDDSLYFMCNVDDFKFLADMIQHVPLPLRARYVFCCAPINRKMPFVCTMFLKFARQYSQNESITFDWLCRHVGWPFNPPKTILDLVHLESVFDVLDLHLWLSYRFQDLFVDTQMIRDTQKELDSIIQMGVFNITRLLKNTESKMGLSSSADDDDSPYAIMNRKKRATAACSTPNVDNNGNSYNESEPSELTSKGKIRFSRKRNSGESSSKSEVNIGKGRLTERLLAQGLITPKILEELQNEWQLDAEDSTKNSKK